ncbi:hypothetical protein CRENBAI_022217 [Crenichthys baileyi]|uniref:Fibronectin type-III domain-containing protein n=1 Tax=Crenichthys baileyi TaxID=28760 RepID=A0AAV9R971_9TELE
MADAIERMAWLYLLNKARERRRLAPLRLVWIHQTIQRRSEFGEFHHLLQELRAEEDRFQRYFRLSPAQFETATIRTLLTVACAQTRQYYFVNNSLTWINAQSICRSDYTDLATIENTPDVDAFLRTTSNYSVPPNAEGFTVSAQDETSITLQWSKVNDNTSFVIQFNGGEISIIAPVGAGPLTHTVSSLSPGTNFTFTLFSVLDNVRSSGVSITAATAPSCAGCQCCPSGTECITTNGAVQCLDPCASYTILNDTWRSTNNIDQSVINCDTSITWNGWYRFYLGQSSAQIPEKCVAENSVVSRAWRRYQETGQYTRRRGGGR